MAAARISEPAPGAGRCRCSSSAGDGAGPAARLVLVGPRARAHEDEEDIVAALTPDAEGIGSGADVTTAVRLDWGTPDDGVRAGARIPG